VTLSLRERPKAWVGRAQEVAQTLGQAAGDYLSLMKPRIILLLEVVTLATMLVAAQGMPSVGALAFPLLGGGLAAGSANAINCYFDRDIDAVMARTRGRPIPARRLAPRRALAFGIAIGGGGFAIVFALVNPLAAFLSLAALLFYVAVYTVGLKRLTPQNIVIGGAAGAMPPLVGWAAATGHLSPAALVLFAIIFLWTPPHFWALALFSLNDYQRAGVPMLPVVLGPRAARRQILLYSVLLVAATILLVPVNGMGVIYLSAALVLGGLLLALALALRHDGSMKEARRLFAFSIVYLAVLFLLMVVDRVAI